MLCMPKVEVEGHGDVTAQQYEPLFVQLSPLMTLKILLCCQSPGCLMWSLSDPVVQGEDGLPHRLSQADALRTFVIVEVG